MKKWVCKNLLNEPVAIRQRKNFYALKIIKTNEQKKGVLNLNGLCHFFCMKLKTTEQWKIQWNKRSVKAKEKRSFLWKKRERNHIEKVKEKGKRT